MHLGNIGVNLVHFYSRVVRIMLKNKIMLEGILLAYLLAGGD